MLSPVLAWMNAFRRDECGAISVEWVFSLMVLLLLGAMASPETAGRWERAPGYLSASFAHLLP